MQRARWISRLAMSVGLFACVGCGGDDCDPKGTPSPTGRPGRPTRTPIETRPRTVIGTPTRTGTAGGDVEPTPTVTPATTPGTASVTPTVSATPTPTSTPSTEPGARLVIGSATGSPGMSVEIAVTLSEVAPGVDIAGTQNDIAFDPTAPIAATSSGRPLCTVNPSINKNATSYSFQPPGCIVGTSCTGIRVLVLALDNVDPIPPGSVLYTCMVEATADASAGSSLTCSMAAASTPQGEPVVLDCEDGEILVAGSGQ